MPRKKARFIYRNVVLNFKMNKKLHFLLVFCLFAKIAFGQSEEVNELFEPTETDSLYILAIENYTKELDTVKSAVKLADENSKIIYLQYESYLRRIPKNINGYKIIRLGLANRKKHFRKNKNYLTLVEISPLTINDGLFKITLIPYGASLKGKRNLDLLYIRYNATYFKYENGKLVMEKNESGGI